MVVGNIEFVAWTGSGALIFPENMAILLKHTYCQHGQSKGTLLAPFEYEEKFDLTVEEYKKLSEEHPDWDVYKIIDSYYQDVCKKNHFMLVSYDQLEQLERLVKEKEEKMQKVDHAQTESNGSMTWAKLNEKYPESRAVMSAKREKDFVNDCFALYEKEGFAKKFWTPYDKDKQRIGQSFTVLSRCSMENFDLECLPMWQIKFADGTCIDAYPEEIIPSEMRDNGCKIVL